MKAYIERYTEDVVIGYVGHKKFLTVQKLDDVPVFAVEDLEEFYAPKDVSILPSIGYTEMNKRRECVVKELKGKGYGFYSFIHPSVHLYGNKIGEGNIILEETTICMNSSIGSYNIIFNNCAISHDVTIGDYNHFSPAVAVSGCVKIGNYCFLGTNSTIKNEITIADLTLVGAGAYVRKSTQEESVIVPAESQILIDKKSRDFIL